VTGYDELCRPTVTQARRFVTRSSTLGSALINRSDGAQGRWSEQHFDGLGRVYKTMTEGSLGAEVTEVTADTLDESRRAPSRAMEPRGRRRASSTTTSTGSPAPQPGGTAPMHRERESGRITTCGRSLSSMKRIDSRSPSTMPWTARAKSGVRGCRSDAAGDHELLL
jgi:hypothetical protein